MTEEKTSLFKVDNHFFVCGITGSGKTTFVSEIYRNLEGVAVFFNTNDEVIVEECSQVKVTSIEALKKAIEEGYRRICFSPKEERDITNADIIRTKNMFFRMGAKINKNRKKPKIWCYIILDETQEYSSVFKKDKFIDTIFKRGRRYGIVGIAISQRPADVSHTILTQCKTHIIFKLGVYETPYFQRYRIPIDEFSDIIAQKYHFVVYDGYEWKQGYPIDVS